MRGVPRLRRAISSAPSLVDVHVEQPRGALHDACEFRDARSGSSRSTRPKRPRSGALTRPWRVVAPIAVKRWQGHGVRARARSGADQDVHAEILERRVEHLLDVRQQAVNLVDEEDLALLDVAENAGEVEFLLQNGSGGLLKATPSSCAMMAASVVLPKPGGPYSST